MASPSKVLCGTVISSGKMMRAVRVRVAHQTYNQFLRKQFMNHENLIVSDPTESTRTGDVIRIVDEGQVSKRIRHVVTEIVAPWGPSIEERPTLPSEEQRRKQKEEKHERKTERRRERARIQESNRQAHDKPVTEDMQAPS